MFRKIFLLGVVLGLWAVFAGCAGPGNPAPVVEPTKSDPLEIKRLPLNEATVYLTRSIIEGMSSRGVESIAVADIGDLENNPTILGKQLAEDLSTDLIRSGKFERVIERRLMEAALKEQVLQLSDLFDSATATRLGRLCGVAGIVSGTINEGFKTVRVNIRVIVVETSECLSAAQVEIIKDEQVMLWLRKSIPITPEDTHEEPTPDQNQENQAPSSVTPAIPNDGKLYLYRPPAEWAGSPRVVKIVNDIDIVSRKRWNGPPQWMLERQYSFSVRIDGEVLLGQLGPGEVGFFLVEGLGEHSIRTYMYIFENDFGLQSRFQVSPSGGTILRVEDSPRGSSNFQIVESRGN